MIPTHRDDIRASECVRALMEGSDVVVPTPSVVSTGGCIIMPESGVTFRIFLSCVCRRICSLSVERTAILVNVLVQIVH